MIFGLIFWAMGGAIVYMWGALVGLVPPPPNYIDDGLNTVATVYGWVLGFDTWIPVNTTIVIVGFILACYPVSWALSLARMLYSAVTFGGARS